MSPTPVQAPKPLQLGLTGGIGSGKSTVTHRLAALGAGVIDADAISRQTTAVGGAAIEPIAQQFGAEFIDSDGALNRARMREHSFSNPQARRQLEAIIHPLVQAQSRAMAGQYAQAGCGLIVWDIPLLVESGRWRRELDKVLVVDCTPETQIRRVLQRSMLEGQPIPEEQIRAIMAAQATRGQRRACADLVIFNEGLSLEVLHHLIDETAFVLRLCQNPRETGLSFAL